MSYTDADIESFTITSRSEIIFYLHQLINDQEPLSLLFDEGRESLLTMLLDLDADKGTLILDWGGSEAVNRRLLQAKSATFVANPLGVRNQFHSGEVRQTTYKGRPAFATKIPAKYVRLQRREYFRLTLPMTQRIPCRFDVVRESRTVSCNSLISDISVGGVGIESKEALHLEQGQIISRALIDLGKFGEVRPDLEVQFIDSITRGNEHLAHAGCQFVKLSRGEESAVQRFITQIQRDQKARLG